MAIKLKNRLMLLIHEKERQENRRLSQTEIAKAIGVSNHTVGSWIRNDVTKFEAHIVEGLCQYFGVGLCDLLYFEEIDDEERLSST